MPTGSDAGADLAHARAASQERMGADAVEDLCRAFADGLLPDSFDDTRYFNVRRMKELNVR